MRGNAELAARKEAARAAEAAEAVRIVEYLKAKEAREQVGAWKAVAWECWPRLCA